MKNLILPVTLLLSTVALAQVPGNVPTTSLEAWWSFNGNGNDLSGNGNHFTNYGAVLTTDRNNASNSAYDYNGSSQYMIVNSPSFSFAQTDSFTVSFWTRKTSNQYGIAVMQSSGASGNFIWIFQSSATGNIAYGTNKQGSSWAWAYSTYGLNQWEHFVGTYANGTMNIYKNGVFVTSSTYSNTGAIQAALPLRLGRSHGGNYYAGKIDDLGVWSRVLSQTEITALYTGCNASVSVQPSDDQTTLGGNAEFGIDVPSPGLSFQWQSNSAGSFQNLSNGAMFQGVTTDTLTLNGATAAYNGVEFRCVVSDGTTCSDTSMAAKLTVCALIATQPSPQTVLVNTSAKFGVVSNDPSATFQWQANGPTGYISIANGSVYTGAQTDTLTLIKASSIYDGKEFRCVITSGICTDTTQAAKLTITTNVGLDELSEYDLKLFPNPTKEKLTLKVNQHLVGKEYRITNNAGLLISSGIITSTTTSLDVSSLPAGSYMLSVNSNSYRSFLVIE